MPKKKLTQKQEYYIRGLKRDIHTGTRWKNWHKDDRDAYESFLSKTFGVTSSKDLGIDELESLANYMQGGELAMPKAKQNQISFILNLWSRNATFPDTFSLFRLIKNNLKKDVQDLKELSKKDAGTLIGIIRQMKPVRAANNRNYNG